MAIAPFAETIAQNIMPNQLVSFPADKSQLSRIHAIHGYFQPLGKAVPTVEVNSRFAKGKNSYGYVHHADEGYSVLQITRPGEGPEELLLRPLEFDDAPSQVEGFAPAVLVAWQGTQKAIESLGWSRLTFDGRPRYVKVGVTRDEALAESISKQSNQRVNKFLKTYLRAIRWHHRTKDPYPYMDGAWF